MSNIKIAVDCLGTDKPLKEVVEGIYKASNIASDLDLVCFGPKTEIEEELKLVGYNGNNVEVIDATYAISPNENPMLAIRMNKEASMTKAFDYLKNNKDVQGFVTCGSTAALIVGTILNLNTIKVGGFQCIPCLSALLPGKDKSWFTLLDCGANIDCKPENLVSFAYLGNAYMKAVQGIEKPRVALLSNGTEDSKGNSLTKEAFKLLKETDLNFIGNIEGTLVTNDYADVIVCEGFTGNVTLKTIEGAAKTVITDVVNMLRKAKAEGDEESAKVLGKTVNSLLAKYDLNSLAGATLLGVDKVIIKGHGAANSNTIQSIVKQAYTMIKNGYLEEINK